MQWLKPAIAVSALLAAGEADALRCQNKLITEGDRDIELERYCGEPVSVRSYHAPRAFLDRHGRLLLHPGFRREVLVEEWTYNFGPHRLMRVVTLENGVVTDIEPLGYGFRERRGN